MFNLVDLIWIGASLMIIFVAGGLFVYFVRRENAKHDTWEADEKRREEIADAWGSLFNKDKKDG